MRSHTEGARLLASHALAYDHGDSAAGEKANFPHSVKLLNITMNMTSKRQGSLAVHNASPASPGPSNAGPTGARTTSGQKSHLNKKALLQMCSCCILCVSTWRTGTPTPPLLFFPLIIHAPTSPHFTCVGLLTRPPHPHSTGLLTTASAEFPETYFCPTTVGPKCPCAGKNAPSRLQRVPGCVQLCALCAENVCVGGTPGTGGQEAGQEEWGGKLFLLPSFSFD